MRFPLPASMPVLVGLAIGLCQLPALGEDKPKSAPPVLLSPGQEEKLKAIRDRQQKNEQKKKAEEEKKKAEEEKKKAEEQKQKEEAEKAKEQEKGETKPTPEPKEDKTKAPATPKPAATVAEAPASGPHAEQLKKYLDTQRKTRETRRTQRRQLLAARWGKIMDDATVRTELRRHARRMARLNHIKQLAEVGAKTKTVERVDKLLTMETGRHERRMAELQTQAQAQASKEKK